MSSVTHFEVSGQNITPIAKLQKLASPWMTFEIEERTCEFLQIKSHHFSAIFNNIEQLEWANFVTLKALTDHMVHFRTMEKWTNKYLLIITFYLIPMWKFWMNLVG